MHFTVCSKDQHSLLCLKDFLNYKCVLLSCAAQKVERTKLALSFVFYRWSHQPACLEWTIRSHSSTQPVSIVCLVQYYLRVITKVPGMGVSFHE